MRWTACLLALPLAVSAANDTSSQYDAEKLWTVSCGEHPVWHIRTSSATSQLTLNCTPGGIPEARFDTVLPACPACPAPTAHTSHHRAPVAKSLSRLALWVWRVNKMLFQIHLLLACAPFAIFPIVALARQLAASLGSSPAGGTEPPKEQAPTSPSRARPTTQPEAQKSAHTEHKTMLPPKEQPQAQRKTQSRAQKPIRPQLKITVPPHRIIDLSEQAKKLVEDLTGTRNHLTCLIDGLSEGRITNDTWDFGRMQTVAKGMSRLTLTPMWRGLEDEKKAAAGNGGEVECGTTEDTESNVASQVGEHGAGGKESRSSNVGSEDESWVVEM